MDLVNPPLPGKPPLCLTRSADLVEARFWPAAGGKFWGIWGTTKGETLQKMVQILIILIIFRPRPLVNPPLVLLGF